MQWGVSELVLRIEPRAGAGVDEKFYERNVFQPRGSV